MLPVKAEVFWKWFSWVVEFVSVTVVTKCFVVCFTNAVTKCNDNAIKWTDFDLMWKNNYTYGGIFRWWSESICHTQLWIKNRNSNANVK